jgi:hypothetical protein
MHVNRVRSGPLGKIKDFFLFILLCIRFLFDKGKYMGRINFLTCCLQSRHDKPVKTSDDAYTVLKNYQTGIYTLMLIQVLVDILWITLTFVNGFALYVVDPSVVVSTGWAHSLSHMGLWFVLEYLCAWLGGQVTGFALEKSPEKSFSGALRFLIVYMVVLSVSMLGDVAHIVLTGLEVGDKESTFAVENWTFLIIFLVVYILYLVIIKVWIFYRCVVYYRGLQEYSGASLVFNMVPSGSSPPLAGDEDVEKNVTMRTPMMEEYYNNRRTKTRAPPSRK